MLNKPNSVSLSYTLAPAGEHRGLPQGSLWYLSTFTVLTSPELSTVLQCQRQRITSLDLQSRSTAQDVVVLLCRGGRLLTHAVFIVPRDPTSVPARLPLRALDHSPCYCIFFPVQMWDLALAIAELCEVAASPFLQHTEVQSSTPAFSCKWYPGLASSANLQ